MKNVLLLAIIIGFTTLNVSAQYRVMPNKPFSTMSTSPGFITINEIGGGYGLGGTTTDYSKYFFGFTTINGYQVNRNFIFAGGTGIYIYNSGIQVPLFLDFRFSFFFSRITPCLFADGGLLIKVSDINYSEVFINPGVGARYAFSRNWAVNAGIGLFTQMDADSRATFVNIKTGVLYKF